MELQFIDRVLTCSDCRSDFIFTAGEQIFFHEKQFKNDPKRCKLCKQRRMTASGPNPGDKPLVPSLARTETRTECSECGIETTVPFKPTQGRPVLCRACFQSRSRIAARGGTAVNSQPPLATAGGEAIAGPLAMPAMVAALQPPPSEPWFQSGPERSTLETASALSEALVNSDGKPITGDAALMAASSIRTAEPGSSVATLADLESIANAGVTRFSLAGIPYELIRESGEEAGELVGATAEAMED